jgi:hypothetical protein
VQVEYDEAGEAKKPRPELSLMSKHGLLYRNAGEKPGGQIAPPDSTKGGEPALMATRR